MASSDNWISELKPLLQSGEGMKALRFLRSVYYATYDSPIDSDLLAQLVRHDLVRSGTQRPSLTKNGYLVGNVAKEYCNWIDNGRQVPDPKPAPADLAGKEILDLGCSYGRWLWYFQLHAKTALGIERQSAYVELGAMLAELAGCRAPRIVTGDVEQLLSLVRDQHFDIIFSRLVFNHVRIRDVLTQCALILRPGGTLWLQTERIQFLLGRFRPSLRVRWLIDSAFATFGIANTLLFNASGAQMRVRLQGRMHDYHQPVYPSATAWRRELIRAGFDEPSWMPAGQVDYAFKAVRR